MPSESEISPVSSPGSAVDVSIRGITKTYGDFHALDDIDLQVMPGEFMTLLGPSGSGKTTLLMVIAGFTRPDKGSLLFDGEEVIRKPPHLRNIGMVFQNYALFPHMSVEQNIAYPLKLRRLPRDQIARQVQDALRRVKLPGYNTRRIDQLSGGQYLQFPPEEWSLRWYEHYFGSAEWMAATWTSVKLAVLTMVVATPVGTLAAYGLINASSRIALFIAGGDNSTITRSMFLSLRDQIDPTIASISTIMIVLSSLLLAVAQIYGRRRGG